MISVLGDFNAKSINWCKNDTTSHEGSIIDAVTSHYGLCQLIQEPTHVLNSPSSCVDLKPNFSPKFSHRIRSPFIFTAKLPSSGSLCRIQFVYFVSTTLQKGCLVLLKSRTCAYSKNY